MSDISEISELILSELDALNATIIRQNFQQHLERYTEYEEVYTDGSKTDEGVGYSAISWYRRSVKRLPNQASVYSAEATAIYDAG
jgi:hypothetical protein